MFATILTFAMGWPSVGPACVMPGMTQAQAEMLLGERPESSFGKLGWIETSDYRRANLTIRYEEGVVKYISRHPKK